MNIFNILSKQHQEKRVLQRFAEKQVINTSANFFALSRQLGVILVVIIVLAACQTESTPAPAPVPPIPEIVSTIVEATPAPTSTLAAIDTPAPPTIPAEAAPVEGGTAILGLVGQTQSLNPITDNNPALREITPLLFDTLLRVDPQTAELHPGLAERWEYTDDGKQVIFHLPPNLTWSDGSPLTAADIAASLEASQHPALLAFSDIGARNETTLVFTFLNIDCSAVTALAQLPLLPTTELTSTMPIGSGPFVMSEWSANKRTLNLATNKNYHGSSPYLNELIIRFLHEDEIAIAVSEGQFDAIGPIELPIVNDQLLMANSQFTIETYSAPQITYIAINYDPHNDDPLAPEVREALLLALDREAILDEALDGDGQLMASSLLPGHWAVNESLSPPDYDPNAARKLLAEAGLKDSDGDGWLDQNGERLELGIRLNGTNGLHQNLGWLVSSYYRDLGLFARAESVRFDSVVDDLFTHDFTTAIFSWPILPDPDQRMYWHSTENTEGLGLNFTSYNNPQVDALLDEGVAIPGCTPQNRAETYNNAQEILAQDRPVDFLLSPHRHLLTAERLHGPQPGPFAPITWNVLNWYVEE